GTIALGAGTLLVGASNGSATYAGNIAGTGNLVKVGTGTQILTGVAPTASAGTSLGQGGQAGIVQGSVTYTGSTIVQSGNLVLGSSSAQNRVLAGGTGGGDVR